MSFFYEPTPLDQPFANALAILKRELSKQLEDFFYSFEQEGKSKTAMSTLLRLHERILLDRAEEIGEPVFLRAQFFLEACSDFANGQGQVEKVFYGHKELQNELIR